MFYFTCDRSFNGKTAVTVHCSWRIFGHGNRSPSATDVVTSPASGSEVLSSVCHFVTIQCTLVLNLHWPSLLAGKWSDRHQTCTQWSPDKPASRICSRSRSMSFNGKTAVTVHCSCSAGVPGSPTLLSANNLLPGPAAIMITSVCWFVIYARRTLYIGFLVVTWYGHFCAGRKIAFSTWQMTGSRRQVCNLTFLPFQ